MTCNFASGNDSKKGDREVLSISMHYTSSGTVGESNLAFYH